MKTAYGLPYRLILSIFPSNLVCSRSNLPVSWRSWSTSQSLCKKWATITRPLSLLLNLAIFLSGRCLRLGTRSRSLLLSIFQRQWRAGRCRCWEWSGLWLGALSIRKRKVRLSWWINTKMLFISERFFWAWEKSKPKTRNRCCSASRIFDLNSL